ncbi:MAG: hypothetical protein IPG04_22400 [Polyangiaceae bacterium]|nr:hypothetical protein [Polyangiaceae bacterium]
MDISQGIDDPSGGLLAVGAQRLRALCDVLGLGRREDEAVSLLEAMLGSSVDTPVSAGPRWPSDVCDDGTPFEFSVAFTPSPVLRVMVEPIAEQPSLRNNAELSRELLYALRDTYGVDLGRALSVWDLFAPEAPEGHFAVWLAAELGPTETSFKIYLNPDARGPALARATIEEAMCRLGFDKEWPMLVRALGRRGPSLDELKFVSLDLSRSDRARLKVYGRHHRSTALDLELAASASPGYRPGSATELLELVAAQRPILEGRAPWTCLSLVRGAAPEATTHFPINGYAADDRAVAGLTSRCLERYQIDPTVYRRAMETVAGGPLEAGVGAQSYVSVRWAEPRPRVTAYFPPEVYRPHTVAAPTMPEPARTRAELSAWFRERDPLWGDPLVQRLGRKEAPMQPLRSLLEQFGAGVIADLPRLLAAAAHRVDGELERSVLVTYLFEMCGSGRPERSAAQGFLDALTVMDPLAARDVTAAARRLAASLAKGLSSPDPDALFGALFVTLEYWSQLVEHATPLLRKAMGVRAGGVIALLPRPRNADEILDRVSTEGVERAWRAGADAACAFHDLFTALYAAWFDPAREGRPREELDAGPPASRPMATQP